MKKLLLSMALVATASACFADDYEFYIGTEVENGEVSNFTLVQEGATFTAHREVEEFGAACQVNCDVYLKAVNNTAADTQLKISVTPVSDNSVGTTTPQICITPTCLPGNLEITVAANATAGGFSSDHFGFSEFAFSKEMADAIKFDSVYTMDITFGNITRKVTVNFSNETASVGSINLGSAQAEYFNLQGLPVANPEKGQIYIVRQGGKVSKAIAR